MKLIAKKPCSFDGKKFFIGDEIPGSLVANPKALEKMGVIAIAANGGQFSPCSINMDEYEPCGPKFLVPIHTEKGDLPIEILNEELRVFTDILQTGVTKTEDKQKISEMIQKVESEDLLILINALDSRKFVKEETQARSEILSSQKQEGEHPGGDL